jgi:hypothetical protein
MGLWDVEDPLFYKHSAHRWRWGDEPYAPAGRALPAGRFQALVSVRGRVNPRAIVRLERLQLEFILSFLYAKAGSVYIPLTIKMHALKGVLLQTLQFVVNLAYIHIPSLALISCLFIRFALRFLIADVQTWRSQCGWIKVLAFLRHSYPHSFVTLQRSLLCST